MISKNLWTTIICCLLIANLYAQDNAIPIEAESADSLGSDFTIVTEGDVTYITPSTDYGGVTNPGTMDKVAKFVVTFAAPGTYELYAKVRVGPNGYDDDSFYFASSFGDREADVDSLWVRVNGIGNGAADSNEYVISYDENSAANEVFKWINASEVGEGADGGTVFVVEEDSLTRTFLIGSRENGLDIDKIAFGNASLYYTVGNLENGEAGVSEIPETGSTLVVDLSDSLRSATHCASGALYGVTASIPDDIDSLVAPLHPNVFVQPARSGSGYQRMYGAAIPVSERLDSVTTGLVMIRLADINPGWPYTWQGKSSWLSAVTSVINDKIASGRDNYYGYEIWNERHGTWIDSTNGDFYTECWEPTYDLIRSLDPDAKIIGPSDSYYSTSRISEFLTYCMENDCLPDIVCWHELQGVDNVSSHIESYRALENTLGISSRAISINEYCHSTQAYEGCPGTSAPFIAKFERGGVESASISWWFTALPGRLGSLLTSGKEKGGGWWFYKWYGDMTGYMANVTPPSESGDGIDGFACLDSSEQYASICLGGNYTGTMDVQVDGIPSSFGDSVNVKVQYVPWSGKDSPVDGPVTVSQTNYIVSDGTIDVPVDIADSLYGYRVYIIPTSKVVGIDENDVIANTFALSQNYPNPFNPTTTISFQVPQAEHVTITVYDILGRKVSELVNDQYAAGTHEIQWKGKNDHGHTVASGLYIYRMQAGDFVQSKKMLFLK